MANEHSDQSRTQDVEKAIHHDKSGGAQILTAVNSNSTSSAPTTSHSAEHEKDAARPNTQSTSKEDPDIVFWDSPGDPENPMNWSPKIKIACVSLVSTWTFLTPLASSMVAPGIGNILADFKSTNATLGSFIVSIYLAGYALCSDPPLRD